MTGSSLAGAEARNRLRDIQHNLAHGDFSIRQLFNQGSNPILEEHVQNFLAGELERGSRSQYTVVREPELTRKARPDIRLSNSRCRGPITIEVKIAERWTVPQLENAVPEQLVAKYMRASNSNYGILVLCSSGSKSWRDARGEELDFSQLVEHLTDYARGVLHATPDIVDVAVMPIDFHEPVRTRRS